MQEENHLKKSTFTNLIWRFAERCGAQGVTFVVSIVLARILDPKDYGIIALITVFTSILQVFVDSGFGNALIQKKNADDLDFSSVFFFNIVLCCTLYTIMFFAAPFIAKFYNNSELTPVIRVLSIIILISGVKNVQMAYVSRTLQFKRFFWATLGGTIGAAGIGIYMACNGYGVWSLVVQQIFNNFVDTVILWITVKWRPKKMFSFKRLKGLFSYGWKLMVSTLINTVYNDIRQLIIGKIYSSSDLAFYNKGRQVPNQVVANINSSIDSVLFPVMSKKQDEKDTIKAMTRRAIKVSSYLMWPLMFGLIAVGRPLIIVLLTEKWLPAFPFLCMFCISFGLQPIHTANLNAIKAMGRSGLFLKMEIIKKCIGILIILITMNISVYAIAVGVIVYNLIVSIINAYPNIKLLGYNYFEQIKDIMPSFLLSFVMCVIVYMISFVISNVYILTAVQVASGIIIYIAFSKIFKLDSFNYLLQIVKSLFHKEKA